MESLFRLVLSRPAVVQSEDAPSIQLAQASAFQADLAQASKGAGRREAMKAAARQLVTTAGFVGDPAALPLADALRELAAALDALEAKQAVKHDDLVKAVKEALGGTPAELVKGKAFTDAAAALRDSIIAIKILPEVHDRPIEGLSRQLRDLEVVTRVAGAADFPGTGARLRRFRRRSLQLPDRAQLKVALDARDAAQARERELREAEAARRKSAEGKLTLYRRLRGAVDELTGLSGDHLEVTPQRPSAGFLVPAALRPLQVFTQQAALSLQLDQLGALGVKGLLARGEALDKAAGGDAGAGGAEAGAPRSLLRGLAFQSGVGEFKPMDLRLAGFRLKATAEGALSASTQQLLKERHLALADHPLDQVVERLRGEALALSKELDDLLGRPVQRTFKRLGAAMVVISTPGASAWSDIAVGGAEALAKYTFTSGAAAAGTLTAAGTVTPAGVADLLVVKQQLVRYEATDVAHIETILQGERKEREHTRRRETEELTLRETEVTTSEERELESTSRFEMSRESSETIKEDASLKAGVSVSGKYGPTVEFSVSAEGSLSRSKEEATKSASRFSQDVTQRTASKVTRRVLERASLRVTNEVTERNAHLLDNTAGGGNVSGVYQWVNKVYQAQMFNYGLRTMFDFMVPEPGAFLVAALQHAHAHAIELQKPTPFALRPDQLTESNYHSWVQAYGATDVQPPPEMYRTKSLDFKAGGGNSDAEYNHSGQLAIEEGYKAVYGTVAKVSTNWEDNFVIDVALGSRVHRFSGGDWVWSTNLDGEQDSIPFALQTWKVANVAAAVEVKCQRTDRALMKWRHDTHAKLTTAYKGLLAEYEKKLAELEAQAGPAVQGQNPALNLALMRDELKKSCIAILTQQQFDAFDAINTGSNGLPQLDLARVPLEGPYVRFFEQAFEWEQATWVTYPYFWGRKGTWEDKVGYADTDPLFNDFIKAGYCRVVVPARPGFEGAIDHYLTFGETWNGGPLPAISSPLYLPIADEIAERLDRPGDELPQGDPWLVRVPTTLVQLRADGQLPFWTQQADGSWAPGN